MSFLVGAVKIVGQLVIGVGVTTVTKTFIKNIVPANASTFTKIAIDIGSWAICGIVGMQAAQQWNNKVDNAVKVIDVIKQIKIKPEVKPNEKPEPESDGAVYG